MDVMNNLRTIRKERKLSQADIAEVLNTTQQQYSKYENGTHEIPIRHIITLCHFYGISSDQLLGITNDRVDENVNALFALDYIDSLAFSSYTDFMRKAQADGKLNTLIKDIGKLWLYAIVSEKLGIPTDPHIMEALDEIED